MKFRRLCTRQQNDGELLQLAISDCAAERVAVGTADRAQHSIPRSAPAAQSRRTRTRVAAQRRPIRQVHLKVHLH